MRHWKSSAGGQDSRGFFAGVLDSAADRQDWRTRRKKIRSRIQLGLKSLVSLTDHDNIEAPLLLRTERETAQTPISLEWSVPMRKRFSTLACTICRPS